MVDIKGSMQEEENPWNELFHTSKRRLDYSIDAKTSFIS